MILGTATLIKPIEAGRFLQQFATFDIWVALLVAVACSAIMWYKGRISRRTGGIFFAAYIGYNVIIYIMGLTSQ